MRSSTIGAVILSLWAPYAAGQGFGAPAELPPASFAGQQFIDSNGCAYIRAGMDGVNTWVPRLNRDRSPLCGFAPTFGQTAAPAATVAAIEPPRRAAEGAPIATIAGAMAAPAPQPAPVTAPAAAPVSPRIIAAPAPVVPAPRTMTFAEACAGRTGVQPNMRSARTGQPIDCGPGAVAVATVAPAPVAPTVTTVAPVAAYGCQSVADAYFTGGTGAAPRCGPGLGTVGLGLPAADPNAPRGMTGATGFGVFTPAAAVVARGASAPAQEPIQWREPVPASNPVNAPAVTAPPAGYRDVWTDGRINPNRGLPPGTIILRQ